MPDKEQHKGDKAEENSLLKGIDIPSISLPKGGGALKGVDEKFQVNAANGTASFTIGIPMSGSRGGFQPTLSLAYNSGAGNCIFGLGWSMEIGAIQRKTDKQLPCYFDDKESDVFTVGGLEDLVPALLADGSPDLQVLGDGTCIQRYLPRIEGAFSRIERIKAPGDKSFFWKITTKDDIITILGLNEDFRIYDPQNNAHVFKWLPCFSYDNKGNCFQFEFLSEDILNVPFSINEQHRRSADIIFTNKYLKRVKYGNKVPFYPDESQPYRPLLPVDRDYFFEVVLDYGDHFSPLVAPAENPVNETCLPKVQQNWQCRLDQFSNYRAGFEIRTYRICKQILFFHTFKELNDGVNTAPYLVRSLNFDYRFAFRDDLTAEDKRTAEADMLLSAQMFSYQKNNRGYYDASSLPAQVFYYHQLNWNKEVQLVSTTDAVNAPVGLTADYQWADIYNEGIPGILTEDSQAWWYKSNKGNGHFAPAAVVTQKPTTKAGSSLQLTDLEGNGEKQLLVELNGTYGYCQYDQNGKWLSFVPFDKQLNVDFKDPNVKFLDVDGDGRADMLISEENVFTVFESVGKRGYNPHYTTPKPQSDKDGAAILFNDIEQCIYLADMTGDGLTDIVRIRRNQICYWPNLGYGKFGKKVVMNDAPEFDSEEEFNPAFLKLADISGTGATDIIYCGRKGVMAWLNLSGNGWSKGKELGRFPYAVKPQSITVADFLGIGTPCIVWSSPLPGDRQHPLRYINLMGGKKPYLVFKNTNGFGKTTELTYKSSTEYYLADKKVGKPWITKLPFPVQCVSTVTITDQVTNVVFTNEYTYHHGFYDNDEREFRGFARVDQTDWQEIKDFIRDGAGNIVPHPLNQPAILTKSWYHTGAWLNRSSILHQLRYEYFGDSYHLPEPVLPAGLSVDECKEALRACKGAVLRQEVYALDNKENSSVPYTVTEHNCEIRLIQSKKQNRYAVFITHESEALTFNYERAINDPRVAHSMVLDFDNRGNVLLQASIVYGRKNAEAEIPTGIPAAVKSYIDTEQSKRHITFEEFDYTLNEFTSPAHYRLKVGCATRSYELKDFAPGNANGFYNIDEMKRRVTTATLLPGANTKMLLHNSRTIFFKDDFTGGLPLGELPQHGIVYETYQLAYQDTQVLDFYNGLVDRTILLQGKYVEGDNLRGNLFPVTDKAGNWWIKSGHVEMPANPAQHFYLPIKFYDPFDIKTEVTYDASGYHLFIAEVRDAAGNTSCITDFDFRVLKPVATLDANDNINEIKYNRLGLVAGVCAKGKGNEGDSFRNFKTEISEAERINFFNDPEGSGADLLQEASARFIYDLTTIPAGAACITREVHSSVSLISDLQFSFEYTDGFGRVVMKKAQCDPGDAWTINNLGQRVKVNTNGALRWIGNGRVVLNNKGKPVKQYEPYFSITPAYEANSKLVEIGVSPAMYYDPLGRVTKTLLPDGTLTRVEFDNWKNSSFDANDTINEAECQWYAKRSGGAPVINDAEQLRAAAIAFEHGGTPTITVLDSLGRSIVSIAWNKFVHPISGSNVEEFYASKSVFDTAGNLLRMEDANENVVIQYKYDLAGQQVYQLSMDAGERFVLNDCSGKAMFGWVSANVQTHVIDRSFYTRYDLLHRPIEHWVTFSNGSKIMFGKEEYGEGQVNDKRNNLRGRLYVHKDGSGTVTNVKYDFKGNLLISEQRHCQDYKTAPDWSAAVALQVQPAYTTVVKYDAVNRAIETLTTDGSITRPLFTKTGSLKKLLVNVKGAGEKYFVKNVEYNARGQRQLIEYSQSAGTAGAPANLMKTVYDYDPLTFRVIKIRTIRSGDGVVLQDLDFTYDPTGNITAIKDAAQQNVYFTNAVVAPHTRFVYDALYRIISSEGREHTANNAAISEGDLPRINLPHKTDGTALRLYRQLYTYDAVGNMTLMKHKAPHPAFPDAWERVFNYNTANASRALRNNQLTSTQLNTDLIAQPYSYNVDGNMLNTNAANSLVWNFEDRLQQVDLGGGGIAYYVYDSGGQRVRKIIERIGGDIEERAYIGSVEIYSTYRNLANGQLQPKLTRETLHISDGKQRIAMVDTPVLKPAGSSETALVRFQFSNHLGTSSVELDETAQIISYEEFYVFGSTSLQMIARNVSQKRYRYTGKERDEETGFYYHGARYYAPWLARWTAADPIGVGDGLNIYCYCKNKPVNKLDSGGQDDTTTDYLLGVGDALVSLVTGGSTPQDIADAYNQGGGGLEGTLMAIDRANPVARIRDSATQAYDQNGGGLEGTLMAIDAVNPAARMRDTVSTAYTQGGGGVEGTLMAVDALNPAARIRDSGGATLEAIDRGDARGAGREFTHTLVGAALYVAPFAGEAAVARGATATPPVVRPRRAMLAAESEVAPAPRAATAERGPRTRSTPGAEPTRRAPGGGSAQPHPTERPVYAQETPHTCASASCRMVLRDLGVNASEQQIARALGTTTEGASVLDITGAMREMGIPRRPGRARSRIRGITASRGGTVSQLESSLAQGDRVVASISEGGGLHAVVVDHIAEGRVFIRDPLPTDLGHSYSISVADFERVYSGRSATFVTGGRAR